MSVTIHKPDEDLTDAFIASGALASTIDTLCRELKRIDQFLRAGVDPPTRLLFEGPSGAGKTLAARYIAWRLRAPIAIVDLAESSGSKIGETAEIIGRMFEAVRTSATAILFVDEIDVVAPKRGYDSSAHIEMSHGTAAFFQKLDATPPGRVVIGATNFLDELDPALRRRFTTHVSFEYPDRDARRRMLEKWLAAKGPLLPEQLDVLADESEGLSGAELRARAMAQARRAIMAGPEPKKERKLDAAEALARGQEILRLLDGKPAERSA